MPISTPYLAPRRRFAARAAVTLLAAVAAVILSLTGVARAAPAGDFGLILRPADDGPPGAAPLLASEVDITVAGVVVRATVRQSFANPSADWVEGTYVFPLPEDAAVDSLRLEVGGRVIEGRIAEREQAKRDYREAAVAGRRAGLVEQERPNVFTASVANIGPGEMVTVALEYQQTLHFADGRYALRFPMVVAPRYIPAGVRVAGAGQWLEPVARVADADRIAPPVRHPDQGPANPLALRVTLDAGMRLAELRSLYHPVVTAQGEQGAVTVQLAEGVVPADRDFVLEWTPEVGAVPRVGLFRERLADGDYLLAVIQPPAAADATPPETPREMILVVDVSGSMAGASIAQARAAVLLALDRLRPHDRFNVIAFNDRTRFLFDGAVTANRAALAQARAFVLGLQANGGTEIVPAMLAALDGRSDAGRLRQVVFLTDGSVGNETEVFDRIAAAIGDSRLFTVGIGSAPNGYFMVKAARFGRGTYTHIGAIDEVAERIGRLFAKLEHPVLTELAVTAADGAVEAWPERLTDVYAGEPVVVAARLEGAAAPMLSARHDGSDWTIALDVAAARPAAGIAKDWARRKIGGLLDRRHEGAAADEIRAAVVPVALAHGLVSPYTSLVAVAPEVARPDGAVLEARAVPVNLPAGMVYEKVFGPQGATAAPLHLTMGLVLVIATLAVWLLSRRWAS